MVERGSQFNKSTRFDTNEFKNENSINIIYNAFIILSIITVFTVYRSVLRFHSYIVSFYDNLIILFIVFRYDSRYQFRWFYDVFNVYKSSRC